MRVPVRAPKTPQSRGSDQPTRTCAPSRCSEEHRPRTAGSQAIFSPSRELRIAARPFVCDAFGGPRYARRSSRFSALAKAGLIARAERSRSGPGHSELNPEREVVGDMPGEIEKGARAL